MSTETENVSTADALDAAVDAVVDLAMTTTAYPPLTWEQRDEFRERMQDAVDGLVDACREYYRELYGPGPTGWEEG